jgi:hypothetical protein
MIQPEALQKISNREAMACLERRLKRAGISTSRPELFFSTCAGEVEEYTDGYQVRVQTWKHWSDAMVTLDAASGEILADVIDRFSAPPAQAELGQEEALNIAAGFMNIPAEAHLDKFDHFEFAPGHKLARLEWAHTVQELLVAGDYLEITIHPETRQIVSYDKKWRAVRLTAPVSEITDQQAVEIIERNRERLDIDPELEVESVEKQIVEYSREPEQPGSIQDRIAWVVTLVSDWGWVEVLVDVVEGVVLAVRRSA